MVTMRAYSIYSLTVLITVVEKDSYIKGLINEVSECLDYGVTDYDIIIMLLTS